VLKEFCAGNGPIEKAMLRTLLEAHVFAAASGGAMSAAYADFRGGDHFTEVPITTQAKISAGRVTKAKEQTPMA